MFSSSKLFQVQHISIVTTAQLRVPRTYNDRREQLDTWSISERTKANLSTSLVHLFSLLVSFSVNKILEFVESIVSTTQSTTPPNNAMLMKAWNSQTLSFNLQWHLSSVTITQYFHNTTAEIFLALFLLLLPIFKIYFVPMNFNSCRYFSIGGHSRICVNDVWWVNTTVEWATRDSE